MAAKVNRAMSRLMGRLSALRQTLRKDERDLLDGLVLGATADEVVAHRMIPQAPEQAARKSATSVAKRANQRTNTGAAAEVVAHSMVSRVDKGAATSVAKRVNPRVNTNAEPEVVAHSMVSRVDKGAATAVAKGVSARIDWDADKKSYRVNGD